MRKILSRLWLSWFFRPRKVNYREGSLRDDVHKSCLERRSLLHEIDVAYKEGTEVAWYSLQCKEDQHPAPPLSRSDPRGDDNTFVSPDLLCLFGK